MNKVDEYYLNMQERLKAEDQLPILHVEVSGKVLASNLDRYRQDALALIDSVSTDLQTEDDFVSAGQAVKWCKTVEDRLDEAKAKALAQTDTIDELFKALDEIKSEARAKRLSLEKLIKNRKDEIRNDLVSNGVAEHANLMLQAKSLIKSTFCVDVDFYVPANFNEAVKNKRTVDSIKEAIEFELRKAKMQIDVKSLSVTANLARFFQRKYDDYRHIFHDISTLCLLSGDEFDAVVSKRVEEAKIKEETIKEQARIAEEKRQERLKAQEEEIKQDAPIKHEEQAKEQKTNKPERRIYQYTVYLGMPMIVPYVDGLDVCEGFLFEDNGDIKRRLDDATATYREQSRFILAMAQQKRIR